MRAGVGWALVWCACLYQFGTRKVPLRVAVVVCVCLVDGVGVAVGFGGGHWLAKISTLAGR